MLCVLSSRFLIFLLLLSINLNADVNDERLTAGDFTIFIDNEKSFSEPSPVLSYKQLKIFKRGRVHFNQKWVTCCIIGGDWGLGPTFITDRCSNVKGAVNIVKG